MICDTCQGKAYPRQCRNSAAWRRAQDAPELCPLGIPLNNLPIGDNAAGISTPIDLRRGRLLCEWAERLSCCKVECDHPDFAGLRVVAAHCTPERCRFFTIAEHNRIGTGGTIMGSLSDFAEAVKGPAALERGTKAAYAAILRATDRAKTDLSDLPEAVKGAPALERGTKAAYLALLHLTSGAVIPSAAHPTPTESAQAGPQKRGRVYPLRGPHFSP